MTTKLCGLEFDPGFAPYILAFQGTVEYLYMDINRFKNLSQKKLRFRQYYNKILDVFHNNLGFYLGCLMWAAYIKTQPEQEIINNPCFGQEYNEETNIAETEFMIKFYHLFAKDMRYFLATEFAFPEEFLRILELYKEFLTLNKGFVETKLNKDVKLPSKMNTKEVETFYDKIKEVLKQEDLSLLLQYKDLV